MRLHRNSTGGTPVLPRAGFTLIELLVVIGLILLLVGITVSISYSGLIDGYKTVGAGDRASGWMLIAKSKAQREGAPRGVRFIINGNTIKEAQFIEVPDPYTARSDGSAGGPRIVLSDNGAGVRTATLVGVNIADAQLNVQAGDTLSLPEFGLMLQLNGAIPNTGVLPVNSASLPALGSATQTVTTAFGFIRKARPSLGEPILQLTGDNAIDVSWSIATASSDAAGSFIDVLFAPNGEVLGAPGGKTIFWVRNTTFAAPIAGNRASFEAAGQMGLVVVYTKTGAIATQPVTLPPNLDPYAATKDGFNTGL